MGTSRLSYHLLWPVKERALWLSPQAWERLGPYITRYAQTLEVTVQAVGGADGHLHLIADVPPRWALAEVNDELRRAAARFLREVLGVAAFAWDEFALSLSTLSPGEVGEAVEYVRDQAARHARGDLRPDWEGMAVGDRLEVGVDPGPDERGIKSGEEELPRWLREAMEG